ncbi:MAG: oxidoreductase [Isosphaeraceae bacterium]|jgi:NADH-quinone oxidoreductase subunit M|nr:MAG: oxidoreductase [Isosphaeraceae bacterium]
MSDDLILSLLWVVPLGGSLLILGLPRDDRLVKSFALGVSVLTLGLAIWVFGLYVGGANPPAVSALRDRAAANRIAEADQVGGAWQVTDVPGDLVVRHPWIPLFNIEYLLGVDGISLSLLLLTGLISVLACLASWTIDKQVKGYFSLFLLLLASMMGVFLALDMFLFFVFFEVMLLPMYFLIAIWGGENREYAAIKFLLYTLFGSALILVGILVLYFWGGDATASVRGQPFAAHSFDMMHVAEAASTTSFYGVPVQTVVFGLLLAGFLVKLPSFPFHTWLPDAHVQAPTPISMILAGVLLKIGGYGLVRLAWPLAPAGAYAWSGFVAALGVFSIVYGALAAMAQTDFKKLVAYSSVSHMGYVTLGMAAMGLFGRDGSIDPRYYAYGVNGALYMMLAHGITSAGMFFLVGVIYDRAHTRDLAKLGGLWNVMPIYGAIGLVIFFGSMGLPGLCGFIAEVFVVLSAFHFNRLLAVVAALAVVLTAGYILWTIQRVWLGRNDHWKGLPDMDRRELVIAAPLVVLTVVMGIFPQAILSWASPSVERMVTDVANAPTVRAVEVADQAVAAEQGPAAEPDGWVELAETASRR